MNLKRNVRSTLSTFCQDVKEIKKGSGAVYYAVQGGSNF